MSLTPSEHRARARSDFRMGVPVVLKQDEAMIVAAAAETLSADRMTALQGLGEPVLVITRRRAETLKARAYDGNLARLLMPADADLRWVQAVADPATDLMAPMKGPFASQRTGTADLHAMGLALAKEARLLPALLVTSVATPPPDLVVLDMSDQIVAAQYTDVIWAKLPMTVAKEGRLHVFRPDDGGEEHYAVEIGRPARDTPVLARLHSACLTGDLLGSLKCDCGPQLRAALAAMGGEGSGILLYLNQEGRGIGLANKMRAYALQDQGFDTVEANHRLGFEDDERDFRIGAKLLSRLGFDQLRLMTNNPAKIAMMEAQGIRVTERVPLHVGETEENRAYLATKAAKSGHMR
ncbi:GTP cyclohydrolase II [Actibacterium sp. 188UL27-1]|uniref:GTP cyclohydrolase II n=1 Tax=Actibacterium sp. 188UL27-1 TaxID=2786961 RepID=UPI001EF64E4C|nr:GTP cyclohydrolase II [Actibacterium sp. 188UL27-1]